MTEATPLCGLSRKLLMAIVVGLAVIVLSVFARIFSVFEGDFSALARTVVLVSS